MANSLQIKRGIKLDLPILSSGEFGLCIDTEELYIGTGVSNKQILTSNLFSSKGDILIGSGAESFASLSSGTINQILAIDPATTTGLKWKDNVATANIVWSVSTGGVCSVNSGYFIDASVADVTMYLPEFPSMGDPIFFKDFMYASNIHTITINRNNNKIEGLLEDLTVTTAGIGFSLTFSNSERGWVLTYITGAEGPKGDPGEPTLESLTTDDLAEGSTNLYFPGFTTVSGDYNFIAGVDYQTPLSSSEQTIFGRLAGYHVDDMSFIQAHGLILRAKNFFDPTGGLPSNPAVMDRYVASATANTWTNGNIYTYNGTSWLETVPTNGYFLCLFDRYAIYKYIDSKWQLNPATYYNYGTTSGAGNTYTFNANLYDCYRLQVNSHTTTINPSGTYTTGLFYRTFFYIVNGGTAALTFSSSIKWTTGTKPTFVASGTDLVAFSSIDGSTWQGSVVGVDYK